MRLPALAAWLCLAQTAVYPQDAVAVAQRLIEHMAQTLAVQPNYTCLEAMERWVTPKNGTRILQDRVRFEVALVDGKEMFAWPGAQKFEVTDLSTMLPGGLVDSGDFAIQVHELFDGQSATFSSLPGERIPESPFTRLDFNVPAERSGLLLNQSKERTGYHGQLYFDPLSLDPRRIHIVVEAPPKLGIRAAVRELNLARVPIGPSNFLLPQSADVTMTRGDGVEFFNHIEFKSCRQFTGNSVLTFEDPATFPGSPGSTSSGATSRDIKVPAGLYLQVRLEEGFNLSDRAVGDPIRATLDSDLKSNGTVLFARGATVEGRITRLTHTSNVILLGVTLEAIVSPQGRASIHPRPWEVNIPRNLQPLTGFNTSRMEYEALIPMRSGIKVLSSAILIFWRS